MTQKSLAEHGDLSTPLVRTFGYRYLEVVEFLHLVTLSPSLGKKTLWYFSIFYYIIRADEISLKNSKKKKKLSTRRL